MKKFLGTVAAVVVGLLVFLIAVPLLFGILAGDGKPQMPSHTVLYLDLREDISDQPTRDPLAAISGAPVSAIEIIRKLDRARFDPKVKGVMVRASEWGIAPAFAEEIRTSLKSIKQANKFVIVHLQGEIVDGSLSGYQAVAPGEIWMQEASEFAASGLAAEYLYLGGMFEKFRIVPEFEQFKEYKSAAESYTRSTGSPAAREATQSMLNSLQDTMLAQIAADRGLEQEIVRAALQSSPMTPAAAIEQKLIDKTGRPEDAEDAALETAGANSEFVDIADYHPPEHDQGAPIIALVGAEGPILSGRNETGFGTEQVIASDDTAAQLIEAAEDEHVKAIVLRVNSPGGSAIASDQIWAAVQRAQKAGKPVVVSMASYAASGGYYISAGADAIVALPTTLTGSIGVYGGKIVVEDALNTYTGLNTEVMMVGGPYTNAFSASERFTNAQREAMREGLARIYDDFKGKVALGRKLTPEQVEELARGRVWTGAQAKANGLVDELGGLLVAVDKAKALAGIAPEKKVRLKSFPADRSGFELLQEAFGMSAQSVRVLAGLGAIGREPLVRSTLEQLQAARAKGVQVREDVRVR